MPNHEKWSHPWTVHTSCLLMSKNSINWCLDAGKRKSEQKLIVLPCLHSPPYLLSRKIGTQSHSAKFLYWGDHVNSVPDLAASPLVSTSIPAKRITLFLWQLFHFLLRACAAGRFMGETQWREQKRAAARSRAHKVRLRRSFKCSPDKTASCTG